jgi:acylphosphatase
MPNEPIARRFVVRGRVQGVGFRWYVLQQAARLGLRGWVRNQEDGSVEVVAVTTPETLVDLEAALRRGPPGARVQNLDVADVPHEAVETKSFTVKH